jgi:hypothetical protein
MAYRVENPSGPTVNSGVPGPKTAGDRQIMYDDFDMYYKDGHPDTQIALLAGCNPKTVSRWRKRQTPPLPRNEHPNKTGLEA